MTAFLSLWLVAVCLQGALGWGAIFNRFSPDMLNKMGVGSHGSSFRSQPFLQNGHGGALETLQELQEVEPEGPCYGKRCTANDHCCPGSVCVDVDGFGSCLFPYGLGQGELCRRHSDCDTGLVCLDTGEAKTCQPPFSAPKQYSEECIVSSECDISKGLCCQLQRRHRQAARKVCSYFKDPMVCLGTVAMDQVKALDMERTIGEKRITGRTEAAAFNHLRK